MIGSSRAARRVDPGGLDAPAAQEWYHFPVKRRPKEQTKKTNGTKPGKAKHPLKVYSDALDRISDSLKRNTIAIEDIEEAAEALFSHIRALEAKISAYENAEEKTRAAKARR